MKRILPVLFLFIIGISWATNKILVNLYEEENEKSSPREYVYLQTDKSLYNPGEIIWFTAFVRKGFDLKRTDLSEVLNVEFYNGRDEIVDQFKLQMENGFTKGEIALDPDLPGGEYRIKAYTAYQIQDSSSYLFEKKIQISTNTLPQLLLTLNFEEKGLQAGMWAHARFEARDLEGNPIAGKNIYYEVALDDFNEGDSLKTDSEGKCLIKFRIPESQKSNFGSLNVIVRHKGTTESINQNIPLSTGKLQVEFYPEGGDWIAGHPSKIAFAAADENGNPVALRGKLLNKNGETLKKFSSFHDGMGYFEHVAGVGDQLKAEIIYQQDTLNFAMPEIKPSGASLKIEKDAKGNNQIKIFSSTEETFYANLCSKEKIMKTITVNSTAGMIILKDELNDLPSGIIRFTLYKNNHEPVAERLFYNEGNQKLKISIENNKDYYLPSSKVKTKIKFTNENGLPVQTDFSLSVADEKNLALADDKQGNIVSTFLLESEIKGKIKDAAFYFNKKEEKSTTALDLLLLTRGWRKFTWIPQEKIIAEKTKIKGRIVNTFEESDTKFYENVTLATANGKNEIPVDENGNFEITGLDISQEPYLVASYKKKKVHFKLTEYYDSLVLYFKNQASYKTATVKTYFKPGNSAIAGTLTDERTGESIPFANIALYDKNGASLQIGSHTDIDGNFKITNLSPGNYQLKITYIGYEPLMLTNITVYPNKVTYLNKSVEPMDIMLSEVVIENKRGNRSERKSEKIKKDDGIDMRESTTELQSVVITSYTTPLISYDQVSSQIITSESIYKMPARRSISSIATVTSEIYQANNLNEIDLHMRGSRSDGILYYIDGVKTTTAPNLPASAIRDVHIITGGIPANYGDVTGGVILINTNNYYDASNYYYNYSYERNYSEPDIYYQNHAATTLFRKGREFPRIIYGDDKESSLPDDRTTLFFSGNASTDENGEAEFEYYTSDQISNFKIICEGIGNGIPALEEKNFYTQLPLTLEAKIPKTINAGDAITIPVFVRNNTSEKITATVKFTIDSVLTSQGINEQEVAILPDSFQELTLKIKGKTANPSGLIHIYAQSGKHECILQKEIETKATGFLTRNILSDAAEKGEFQVEIANEIPGTIHASVELFPSQLSQIIDATRQILREPHGCFEQVSSSTYPNLMVLNLLRSTDNNNEELEANAQKYLESGYQQLAAYETPENGFSLWGKAPANVSLTAFGLMEFTHMQKYIHGVDENMLQRTRRFLLDKRTGNGKFMLSNTLKDPPYSAYDSSVHCYTIWAMASAGLNSEIKQEIEFAGTMVSSSDDSYRLALVALTYQLTGDVEKANELIGKIKQLQLEEGSWNSAGCSVMRSGTLKTETTALCILALLKDAKKNKTEIMAGIKFLSKSKNPYYGFGSTQATGLVIQSLAEFSSAFSDLTATESFQVNVNGTRFNYNLSEVRANETFSNDISKLLHSGKNNISFEFKPDSWVPDYQVTVEYISSLPANHSPMLSLSTSLSNPVTTLGKQTELKIHIRNDKKEIAYYPLATIEIPNGMSVPFQQLVALKENNSIDHYEIHDNYVVLYLPDMPAGSTKNLSLYLKAEFKGTFVTSANSIYPYYDVNKIYWDRGFTVNIK